MKQGSQRASSKEAGRQFERAGGCGRWLVRRPPVKYRRVHLIDEGDTLLEHLEDVAAQSGLAATHLHHVAYAVNVIELAGGEVCFLAQLRLGEQQQFRCTLLDVQPIDVRQEERFDRCWRRARNAAALSGEYELTEDRAKLLLHVI